MRSLAARRGRQNHERVAAALAAAALLLLLILPAGVAGAAAGTDWPTYGFDTARTGFNPVETTLSTANVAHLRSLWSKDVGSAMTAQPVYAAGVQVGAQTLDVLYVGTEAGDLVALNALTGAELWRHNLGTIDEPCGDDGVTGSPVIDRATGRIYAVGGADKVYAYDLATGSVAAGWPVTISNRTATEHVWGALTLANNRIYVVVAGVCGDPPPYTGRVMAIDPSQPALVDTFVTVPARDGGGGGIWGFGGVSVWPASGDVYAASGNALNSNEGIDWAEHVLRLRSDLRILTANNPGVEPRFDFDFGTTPVLFQRPGCQPQFTALNKNGNLYLYNQVSFGFGPVQTIFLWPGQIGLTAYWPVRQFVVTPVNSSSGRLSAGLAAYRLGSNCRLSLVWNTGLGSDTTFSSATIANGLLFAGTGDNGQLVALNAASGAKLGSFQTGGAVYTPPIVVNGRVYAVSWDHKVYAFGLP